MSEADKATNLTGVWDGEYWYGAGQDRTRFVATLFETTGSFEGTTLELAPPVLATARELPANVMGARDGADVSFVKAYEVKTRMKLAPIAYTGVADAALSLIEGRWRISGSQPIAGGFVMRRISSPGVMASQAIAKTAKTPRKKSVVVEEKKRRQAPIKVD